MLHDIDWSDRFWSKVHPEALSGCWLWHGGVNEHGYGIFGRGRRKDGVIKAHRHAYQLTKGPIPDGLVVRHRCDVPACVNPEHLELGTQKDNARDSIERGRAVKPPVRRGRDNVNGKLDEDAVRSIRRERAAGTSLETLAKRYGVGISSISRVALGRCWSWVT